MKRRFAGAAVAMALVALTAGAPSAPAAPCPNEAFRTGPSALLGECRAYEMVTPVDKESGVGVYELAGSHVAPSGDGIYFASSSAYAGAQANTVGNPYVAGRTAEGWETRAIGSPQAFQGFAIGFTTSGVSDDLALSLTASKEALAPGAIPFGSNLYLRDNRTGAYTLVAAAPGHAAFFEWTSPGGSAIPLAAATADWSHLLIYSQQILAPGGIEGQPNLYEFGEGQLRLAVAGARTAGGPDEYRPTEAIPNVISADGSRFFYAQGGLVYRHQEGEPSLLVSEDEEGQPVGRAAFLGASPDGETALFNGPRGALYRFEASAPPGARVTRLTPESFSPGETNVLSAVAGEDADFVYFVTTSRLTSDAAPINGPEVDIYVWHGEPGQAGELRFVGQSDAPYLAEQSAGPTTVDVSPDGRTFAFESFGRVTPDAVDGSVQDCPTLESGAEGRCSNVFLYSYDEDRLSCASCSGSPPLGNSVLGGKIRRFENRTVPSATIDGGTVYFDTPNALVPSDANGTRDAYAWRGGVAQLVSGGTDPAPSSFVDASPDGSNVFFETQQPLVGQDVDRSTDLYDARIGGGLPQGAPATTPPCITGNDCRASTSSSAPPLRPASGAGQAGEGAGRGCLALTRKAKAAGRRARALSRRLRHAEGKRAKALRKAATREAGAAKRLGRRAGTCTGGGR